jgi:hypothetical protein
MHLTFHFSLTSVFTGKVANIVGRREYMSNTVSERLPHWPKTKHAITGWLIRYCQCVGTIITRCYTACYLSAEEGLHFKCMLGCENLKLCILESCYWNLDYNMCMYVWCSINVFFIIIWFLAKRLLTTQTNNMLLFVKILLWRVV